MEINKYKPLAPELREFLVNLTPDVSVKDALSQHGWSLVGTDMSSLTLGKYRQEKLNFAGVDLSRSNLFMSMWINVNLTGAILTGSHMDNSEMKNVDATGATMSNISMKESSLTNVTLDRATMNRAQLQQSTLHNVSVIGTVLTYANLTGVTESGTTNLTQAVLERTIMPDGETRANDDFGILGDEPLENIITPPPPTTTTTTTTKAKGEASPLVQKTEEDGCQCALI